MKAKRNKAESRLLEQRRAAARKLAACGRLIKASLVVNRRKCGNPRCLCADGDLHKSLAFTYKQGAKSVMIHVPEALEADARRARQDYLKLKRLVDRLSVLNVRLLKAQAGRRGKR